MKSRYWYVVLVWALAGCSLSIRSSFRDAIYTDRHCTAAEPCSPEENVSLHTTTTIVPLLVGQFHNSREVSGCYEQLSEDDDIARTMLDFGHCLSTQTRGAMPAPVPPQAWQECMGEHAEALVSSCDRSALSQFDLHALPFAIATAAEGLHSYIAARDHELTEPGAEVSEATRSDVGRAFSLAGASLRNQPTTTRTQPVVALSGGAANGAFTAGYLYALLRTREQAIAAALDECADTNACEPATELLQERVHAVAGTSVGALQAQVLDLYFTEGGGGVTLDDYCSASNEAYDVHDSRALQRCALHQLHDRFTELTESDLLCVDDGIMTQLIGFLGNQNYMVRFLPMQQDVLDPFLRSYGELTSANDVARLTVAVDLEQNVIAGLDDRMCAALATGRDPTWYTRCLGTGVMASLVAPAIVRAEPRIFTGLEGRHGEAGVWTDGGVRSGAPIGRAVHLSDPSTAAGGARMLVLTTARAEGQPVNRPAHLLSFLASTVGATTHQMILWEVAYAQALADLRTSRFCSTAPEELCPSASTTAAPAVPAVTSAGDSPAKETERLATPTLGIGQAFAVFIPDAVPAGLIADGYGFDPFVMRGLFRWGMYAFHQQYDDTLQSLGWGALLAAADVGWVVDEVRADPDWSVFRQGESEAQRRQRVGRARARVGDPSVFHNCRDFE